MTPTLPKRHYSKKMFIRFCAYLLLVTLTVQSFHRSLLTMDYQINLTEYLAQCINQNRPELFCNGQCILMKKINDSERTDSEKNVVAYEYSALYKHTDFVSLDWNTPLNASGQDSFPPYLSDYTFDFQNPTFRPPIV